MVVGLGGAGGLLVLVEDPAPDDAALGFLPAP
jgi:hypothetical protein